MRAYLADKTFKLQINQPPAWC